MKEFMIRTGTFHEDCEDLEFCEYYIGRSEIATFYELTYRDAIEAAIEILTLNDEASIAEIYSRTERHSSLMVLRWDPESKRVYPLYGKTIIKELPDRQSVIDYCLKMKGKRPERGSLGYLREWTNKEKNYESIFED